MFRPGLPFLILCAGCLLNGALFGQDDGQNDAVVTPAESSAESSLERFDRAFLMRSPGEKSGDAKKDELNQRIATAFFVRKDEHVFLVTAGHAAKETTPLTRLEYRTPTGESRWVAFIGLRKGEGDPWRYHKESDVACMQTNIQGIDKTTREHLLALAIDWKQIHTAPLPRTTEIDVVGFPLGLGAHREISALVVRAHVASKEIGIKAKWGHERRIMFAPPTGRGCSGGPAFLASNDVTEAKLIGVFIGLIFDDSGGKLGQLAPVHFVTELIESEFLDSE